jgi:hypothetical protein
MHLAGTELTSDVEEGSKMKLWEHDVPGLSQTSASLVNGEDSRQPVHRRSNGLTIRIRGINCMLADIQAQIEMLRREKTYLRLVRAGLAGMEAEQRGSSPCNTSLKEGGAHVRVEAAGSTCLKQ